MATARNTEANQLRWRYAMDLIKPPELNLTLTHALQQNRRGNLTLPTRWQNFKLSVPASRTVKLAGQR